MGQYLAIGIDHKYVVSQDSAEKVGKTLDEIVGIFGLLSDLLAEKFSKYKLAKTFNVYITG